MTIVSWMPIHGNVTAELLMSIFHTRSPMHDGAVIVQSNVLEAAACILPLSPTMKSNGKVLGTRHRAGLGLTEQAGVLSLLVTEASGRVYVAGMGTA